jgi:hypothetical protein
MTFLSRIKRYSASKVENFKLNLQASFVFEEEEG